MIALQPAASQKITARHLSRQAMLYVRQSTLHQVLENTESTARQYALRERAIALGWEASRIVVIDQDLGQSEVRLGSLQKSLTVFLCSKMPGKIGM